MSNRIDVQFLLLGTLMLVAGVILGITMGIRQDFQLTPVHAHMNLVGWVSLMLFGLVYRAYPSLASRKVAKVHFYLSAIAAVVFPIGIAMAVIQNQHSVAIAGSLIWLAGSLVFLFQLLNLLASDSAAAVPAE